MFVATILCVNSDVGGKKLHLRPRCLKMFCSMMRGRIKGTDSTINAILATAVLYELRWKIWNCAGKIQFIIKTVMTNTVAYMSGQNY